ncbi:type II toxin-antitoxin system RelE/ParE family toxin [Erythrobacter sp. EC-HK427]|uniref:type II toxin-antitoxin system RelE/ParE family toxin n=1 Tax=Erythrobacter sp. EC-HK427 TaxID=2038396 RepID=UPI0012573A54|nr:type II toxin-antitoxin system RelE/ParE family toxin [Erythrobacter sp. EC-HK427]VVT13991.1 Toxin ParE1 [Erythrobacter sp. EC-HK427]
MLEIVYTPHVHTKLEEIADYTIAEWGQTQAKKYLADIRSQIEFAAEFPGIGSAVYGLSPEYRKLKSGSHRIIYRTNDSQLIVVRIVHERDDVPDDLDR